MATKEYVVLKPVYTGPRNGFLRVAGDKFSSKDIEDKQATALLKEGYIKVLTKKKPARKRGGKKTPAPEVEPTPEKKESVVGFGDPKRNTEINRTGG